MDIYFSFLLAHWELSLATLIVILLIVIYEGHERVRGIAHLSVQRAVELINRENAVVLDIRDGKLFKEGHILHAVSMPIHDFQKKISQIEKYKQQPIILVCAMGNQSMHALKILNKHGFKQVYSLKGGMGAWRLASFPVVM